MRILITSFYYNPEVSPRSFRTEGLVNYFLKRGAIVDLYIPDYGYEHKHKDNLNIYSTPSRFTKKQTLSKESKEQRSIQDKIPVWLKSFLRYFFGTKDLLFFIDLYKGLKKNRERYDGIISINLPISVAIGTAMFIRKTRQNCKVIAEYGDPYFYSTYCKRFFIHRVIENWALKYHDLITIPTDKIIDSFLPYKKEKNIKTIPQGFDLSHDYSKNYKSTDTINFVYGGLFYEGERDPSGFLEMLSNDYRGLNFTFTVYTDKFMKINNGVRLLDTYKDKLKDKLIIEDFVSREVFLETMSKSDFLINIETRNAAPSKLIDYKLSTRPVLNIDKKNKFKQHFKEFIENNYENDFVKSFDLEKYDINTIGKDFFDLLKDEA
jgi:hypothetical protein